MACDLVLYMKKYRVRSMMHDCSPSGQSKLLRLSSIRQVDLGSQIPTRIRWVRGVGQTCSVGHFAAYFLEASCRSGYVSWVPSYITGRHACIDYRSLGNYQGDAGAYQLISLSSLCYRYRSIKAETWCCSNTSTVTVTCV